MSSFDPIKYINSKLVFGSKPGLERISALLLKLGNPQEDLKFIHIAGTNGKGSTANYLMNIYRKAGYKTGLYISPFVNSFEERISVDGQYIDIEDLTEITKEAMPFCEEMEESPTEFELITAIAFLYFKKKKCDLVILETGLGGRFDATNVISHPLVSVITSISFDHMQYLGNTLPEIAFEKCGIIKKGGKTVCYPLQDSGVLDVIQKNAREKENELIIPDTYKLSIKRVALNGSDIVYKGINIHIPLPGEHQIYNLITALEAVFNCQGFTCDTSAIVKGVFETVFPARFEVISKNPLVVIEGAHNSDGIDRLVKNIKTILKDIPLIVVMGMLSDKGYKEAVFKIAPLCKTFIGITPDNIRAVSSDVLCAEASRYCNNVIDAVEEKTAARKAFSEYRNGYAILVCGSLYIAGGMKRELLSEIEKYNT